MDFEKLIQSRYSCRHYSPEPVKEDQLAKVLEAARLAPTAANRQPFRIILINTDQKQDQLLEIYHRDWFVQPTLILCVCSVPEEGWSRRKYDDRSYAVVDAAIVMDHITLQAADLGLGTCWIGDFNPESARDFLQLPDDVEPIAFTPLGYPLDEASTKKRKPLEDIVRRGTW